MVFFGVYCFVVSALFIVLKWVKWSQYSKPILYLSVLTGPLAMLAIEFGWFLAEQPWILRGYLKVAQQMLTD